MSPWNTDGDRDNPARLVGQVRVERFPHRWGSFRYKWYVVRYGKTLFENQFLHHTDGLWHKTADLTGSWDSAQAAQAAADAHGPPRAA